MKTLEQVSTKIYELYFKHQKILERLKQEPDNEELQLEEARVKHEINNDIKSFKIKADAYAKAIRVFKENAETCRKEIERLTKRMSSFNRMADNCSNRLSEEMQKVGTEKLKTALHTFSHRNYEHVEVIDNYERLPKEYRHEITTFRPNKKLIKQEIKAGKEIPYCKLISKKTLTIR